MQQMFGDLYNHKKLLKAKIDDIKYQKALNNAVQTTPKNTTQQPILQQTAQKKMEAKYQRNKGDIEHRE